MQPRAGGCLLALCLLLGAGLGALVGEGSAGVLIGFGVGVLAAVALMLWDRRRGR